MRCNKLYVALVVLLLTALTSWVAMPNNVRGNGPVISVDPSAITVTAGQDFTVDVVISGAVNIYAFQFSLSFDKTKLKATAIDNGGFLNEPTIELANIIDNSVGYVSYSRTSVLPAAPQSGSSPPPLATIHFKALAAGNTNLQLYNTILNDDNGFEIDHTTIDGQATIKSGAKPVGGFWEAINMLTLLAPWIASFAAAAASAAALVLYKRRLRREKN